MTGYCYYSRKYIKTHESEKGILHMKYIHSTLIVVLQFPSRTVLLGMCQLKRFSLVVRGVGG